MWRWVDDSVQVPREYVKDGEIVLNVSMDATSSLKLGNDFIEFKARFAGKAREIMVPVSHVIAIYARENGQGMAFPAPPPGLLSTAAAAEPVPGRAALAKVPEAEASKVVPLSGADEAEGPEDTPPSRPPTGGRPALKRVK